MIQRKQTIFLLIALVLNIVCLCLPIGRFVFQTMGADATLTNLWIRMSDGSLHFSVWYRAPLPSGPSSALRTVCSRHGCVCAACC